MKTKLRYVERIEMLPASLTSSVGFTFRGNGIQDPYAGIGGHQPRGFDQFMAIYETFTVLASSCKASCTNYGYMYKLRLHYNTKTSG